MVLEGNYYSEFSSYFYALLTCALGCCIWLLLSKNRSSMRSNNIQNATEKGKEIDKSTMVETKREEKAAICTSLSCIRCSKSIYSVEKLLKKWSTVEQQFKTDQDTKSRIRNGILNTSKRLEKYERRQQEPTVVLFRRIAKSDMV